MGDGVEIPGLQFPVSMIGLGLMVLVAFARKPTHKLGIYWWVPWALFLLLLWAVLVSVLASPTELAASWPRRSVRIAAVILFALVLATGRIHIPSVLKALALGLCANAVAFYSGLTPDYYGGLLTGWLGDKNKAGLYYSVVGILFLLTVRRFSLRLASVLITAGLLWLTGSRTSMSAYAFGLLWLGLASRLSPPLRWLAAGATIASVTYLEENFAQAGVFESRWGSDLLRGRIDAAAVEKLASAPPQGMGLGEAYVMIEGKAWYFHDSYATLLVEGGWPYAFGMVFLTALVGIRPFLSVGTPDFNSRVSQAATVVLLICAWKLGEVFLTIPWALCFGVALRQMLDPINRKGKVDERSPVGVRDG